MWNPLFWKLSSAGEIGDWGWFWKRPGKWVVNLINGKNIFVSISGRKLSPSVLSTQTSMSIERETLRKYCLGAISSIVEWVMGDGVERLKIVCSSLEEFLNAKKLRTLQGANQNSSLRSSDNDLLGSECAVLVFWLKFLKSSQTIFSNLGVAKLRDIKFVKG